MGNRSSSSVRTAVAIVCLVLPLAAQAPPQSAKERVDAASRRARERIRALQREADALATQESALLVQLRKLEVERQLKTEELRQIERDRVDVKRKLDEGAARAATLQKMADSDRPEIEGRLVQVYKLGQAGYWRLLLDVDDLRSLGRAYRTAAALTRIDRDRVVGYQRTLEALGRERRELQEREKQIATLQDQARKAAAALDRAVAARSALVASIDGRRDLNAQLVGELQSAQQKLQASVTQLGTGAAPTALPLRPFQGALPWPARGRVTLRFGRQPSSEYGTAIPRNGIEIAVTEGQAVRAVHEGVVAYAGQFTGYGNLIIVDHGDRSYSLYGHLEAMQVARGERVEAQAPIGLAGQNPSGNPSLYFELRVDGKPVDPLQWLQKGTP